MGKFKDLTGQCFGRWTVVKIDEGNISSNRSRFWICKCSCGNTKSVSSNSLRMGQSLSCGCLQKESASQLGSSKTIDLEYQQRFGKLVVLRKSTKSKENRAYWVCKCDCGNIVDVSGKQLRSGRTKSCGCYKKEYAVENCTKLLEPNEKFGKLTTIDLFELNQPYGDSYWNCVCECGNLCIAQVKRLRNGSKLSCGCIKSYGESLITGFLNASGVLFQREFSFDDLRGVGGRPLKFDFAIMENDKLLYLVEFDGEQHYNKDNEWYNEDMVVHDKLKDKYCERNGITLIRLSDYKNLTDERLDFYLFGVVN